MSKMEKICIFVALLGIAAAVKVSSKDGEQERVQGGHQAVLGQFYWNAAVRTSTDFLCSAVLIKDEYLLTSAECVLQYVPSPNDISVHLGGLNSIGGGTTYNIDIITVHPLYTPEPGSSGEIFHAYNIAVLKTSTPVITGLEVAPISLPKSTEPVPDGTYVQLCGWGGQSQSILVDLMFGYTSTSNVYACIQEIGSDPSVQYFFNLCTPAYQPESGAYSGACHYDHGAGLIIDYNTSPLLVGLVSYANCDNTIKRSTIYTSIVGHRSWIIANTQNIV